MDKRDSWAEFILLLVCLGFIFSINARLDRIEHRLEVLTPRLSAIQTIPKERSSLNGR